MPGSGDPLPHFGPGPAGLEESPLKSRRFPFAAALLAVLLTVAVAGCNPAPIAVASELPGAVQWTLQGAKDPEGFCLVRGSTNLAPGSRVLVSVTAAAGRGADLSEHALVAIAPDGTFAHRTLLSYPVSYEIRIEYSRAGNPDRAEWFDRRLTELSLPDGLDVQREIDGTYKLVGAASWRIGTREQEDRVLGSHLETLDRRLDRLLHDRRQLERLLAGQPPLQAAAAYVAWARIRLGKERELGMDGPDIDPFFGRIDLELRALWRLLDQVALHHLARALDDQVEAGRLAPVVARFDRRIQQVVDELERLTGTGP